MADPTNKQLREFMMRHFNDQELETFCADYFPEVYDNFSRGLDKNEKVLALMGYCRRREMMTHFLVNLRQERENPYREKFTPQQKKTTAQPQAYVPQPRNSKQIFICHASQDAALAQRIAQDLQAQKFDIFITPTSVHPGEKWVPAINRGLEESGIFLVLLTPHAVQSGWVQDETNTAIALANRGEARLYLLDVEACRVPILWQGRQFISFRSGAYKQNLERLLQALDGRTIKQPPAPVVTSPTPEEATLPRPPEVDTFVHEKTSLEFVRVPTGKFLYGENKETRELSEYWISKTPVTHAVYKRFIDANPTYDVPCRDDDEYDRPYNWDKQKRAFPHDKVDHPVVLVSWYDAIAFCKWAGLQLPTEEQWEKAARGTDGRRYPWGNNSPPDKLCNFKWHVGSTTAVGHYSPQGNSPYGCVDMSGNVWEWCLSKYETPEDTAVDRSNVRRVVRGGSWDDSRNFVRAAYRLHYNPDFRNNDYGFRVVLVRPRKEEEPAAKTTSRQTEEIQLIRSKPKKQAAPEPVEGTFVHEKTGLEFVRVPVGKFLYGDNKETRELSEYWISKTPVTHAVYKRFIDANPKYEVPYRKKGWAKPYNWDQQKRMYQSDKADHPVVLVSWYDAMAFCEWAGLQLPTEEQWEKAARGTDGRKYPWGNDDPTDKLCNFNNKVGSTTAVGQYSPQGDSPFGCVDMSGNVWEWCLNKYKNPKDTAVDKSNNRRVLRGGSWFNRSSYMHASYRNSDFYPGNRGDYYGFRVVVVRPPS